MGVHNIWTGGFKFFCDGMACMHVMIASFAPPLLLLASTTFIGFCLTLLKKHYYSLLEKQYGPYSKYYYSRGQSSFTMTYLLTRFILNYR